DQPQCNRGLRLRAVLNREAPHGRQSGRADIHANPRARGSVEEPGVGNAPGGLLRQLFTFDVTVTRIVCRSADPLAVLRLYGHPMGSILRCPDCYAALIYVVA